VTFLAPLALWGLLALAIPLLLHLRRRRVGRTIQVGSLKHLETAPTAERRGPRVRDPLRLLLRLAIIALVALLLAEPVLPRPQGDDLPVILADSGAAPWDAIARVDDSLPPGIPLTVVATLSSDRFHGPRPLVRRRIDWVAAPSPPPATAAAATDLAPHTPRERRALDAAIGAAVEFLGAPGDTVGWEARLPEWWRDSLDSPSFPVGVARALIPSRALPPATLLTVEEAMPRVSGGSGGGTRRVDLHWWVWVAAATLFLLERLWARRLERGS
jgi:hypothetical protein